MNPPEQGACDKAVDFIISAGVIFGALIIMLMFLALVLPFLIGAAAGAQVICAEGFWRFICYGYNWSHG